jgi:hypothetical protein
LTVPPTGSADDCVDLTYFFDEIVLNSQVSTALDTIVARATATDPADRYPSTQLLLAELVSTT